MYRIERCSWVPGGHVYRLATILAILAAGQLLIPGLLIGHTQAAAGDVPAAAPGAAAAFTVQYQLARYAYHLRKRLPSVGASFPRRVISRLRRKRS